MGRVGDGGGEHRAASVRPTKVRGWRALSVGLVALGACGDDTTSNAPEEARPPLAPLSARIELDAQTVTIGGTIDGRVVVFNDTGQNIDVTGCDSIFQVALANEEYEQQPFRLACAEPFTIATGESSYPVTVRAEHLGCSGGPPPHPDDMPVCDSPFPLGDYEARLHQGYKGRKAPEPPPVHVQWSMTHNCRSDT